MESLGKGQDWKGHPVCVMKHSFEHVFKMHGCRAIATAFESGLKSVTDGRLTCEHSSASTIGSTSPVPCPITLPGSSDLIAIV